jgi:hypothetical protein
VGQTNKTENSKRRPNEDEAREKKRNRTNADQKAKELEEIQKYIAQQKESCPGENSRTSKGSPKEG